MSEKKWSVWIIKWRERGENKSWHLEVLNYQSAKEARGICAAYNLQYPTLIHRAMRFDAKAKP